MNYYQIQRVDLDILNDLVSRIEDREVESVLKTLKLMSDPNRVICTFYEDWPLDLRTGFSPLLNFVGITDFDEEEYTLTDEEEKTVKMAETERFIGLLQRITFINSYNVSSGSHPRFRKFLVNENVKEELFNFLTEKSV